MPALAEIDVVCGGECGRGVLLVSGLSGKFRRAKCADGSGGEYPHTTG